MFSLTTSNLKAQDLMARQAPIDVKMRAVDSLAFRRLLQVEQMQEPSIDLYPDWNNVSVGYDLMGKNFSLSKRQPIDTEGKVPQRMLFVRRELPSRRTTAESRYLPS